MPHRSLTDLSADHDLPVQRTSLLAMMFAASAVAGLLAACTLPAAVIREEVLYAGSAVGLVVAGALWTRRRRLLPSWVLHAVLLFYSLSIAAVVAHASTTNGITSLGPAVIVACAYAGCFYTGGALGLHLTTALGGYALGALLAPPATALASVVSASGVALGLGLVLHRLTTRLRQRILVDPLTRTVSRAVWLTIADGELRRRGHRPLTVAMIDLDKFKQTNDTLGHLAGDDLLRTVAAAWQLSLGQDGLLGRYGGDEFVILFLDTDEGAARQVMDRLDRAHPARWTAGLAAAHPEDTLTMLLHRVDHALRDGKQNLQY